MPDASISSIAPYVPSTLLAGDTLATLATLYRITAADITSHNGVQGSPGSCVWGRDIARWVLATGGKRCEVVATQPNTCEPGLGFPCFVGGQQILLPAGGPRQNPGAGLRRVSTGINYLGLAVILAGLALKNYLVVGAGVAVAARIGPFK
jgi:hypothetical protein